MLGLCKHCCFAGGEREVRWSNPIKTFWIQKTQDRRKQPK